MSEFDTVHIGLVSISDRASSGVYEDKGLPALREWLTRALRNPVSFESRLIADEQQGISDTLIELVDVAQCSLVLTTGGTGPAARDVTPAVSASRPAEEGVRRGSPGSRRSAGGRGTRAAPRSRPPRR